LAGIGWSWGKFVERAGILILVALILIISWVLAVRGFEWVLDRLE